MDALYDCLTGLQEETKIVVRNRELLKKHLGKYAISFLQVLVQAEQECRNLCLKEE
ncbi:MAG: barstar family protein [Lachnospiraceae bacterium]|nr:barstar family protein [Lachnospiraceae bacterium]